MNNPKISLCLAYPNYNNPGTQILFRVADYYPDDDILYEISFHDDRYSDTPKRIGAHPRDVSPGLTALREWEYDNDDIGRTRSYNYAGNIYEIVFPEELKNIAYSDTNEIRRILSEGFTLDDNISSNILIAIGKSGSHNALLLCRKRDLKKTDTGLYAIVSNKRDMLHSVHHLEEYDILDSSIIDTSSCRISLPGGYKAPTRYFYNSTTLPESVGIFHPIVFSKYIPTFISNYIKKHKATLQFNLNDIRKITDILDLILDDHEYIEDFFKITGYTQEQLGNILPQYKQTIIESFLSESSIDAILQQCLLQDKDMHKHFIEIVRTSWLEEKSEEKQKVLEQLETLKKSCLECESDLIEKTEKKNTISAELFELEKDIISNQEKLSKIRSDIETELKEFSDNIVHNSALLAVAQSVNNTSTATDIDLITLGSNISDAPDFLTDHDDFQESLADNLITIGYDDSVADEMAQLISYSICEHLPILVNANEDAIAKCIAAMFGTAVTVINLSNSMRPSEYISAIQNTNNTVILVNGAFSGFSIEHFNSIRYRFANEGYITLFSISSADVGLIPRTVHENSMYLECGHGYSYSSPQKLMFYNSHYSIFLKSYDKDSFTKQRKKLTYFIENGIIDTVTAVKYAKYMVDIECDIHKDWLLLLQICIQARTNYKTDIMKDWLISNNIDINILNNYL